MPKPIEAQLRLALRPATPEQLALFPHHEINRAKLILIRSQAFAEVQACVNAGIRKSPSFEAFRQLTKRCMSNNGA